MAENQNSSRTDIRNLLIVILSGVLGAFVIAGIMLHYYGPNGRYYARNVLLSPQLAGNLSYEDDNPKTGKRSRFIFDSIDFSYYDTKQKKWIQKPVSNAAYGNFYDSLGNELSLQNVTDEIQNVFLKDNPAKMVIKVRTESNADWQIANKIFQQVEIASEYYRVQLRTTEGLTSQWAYFRHPGILNEAMNLLSNP